MSEKIAKKDRPLELDISDSDIYEAMKDIPGYLDITPADLKEIYKHAYRHALERLTSSVKASDIMTTRVFSVIRTAHSKEVAELLAKEGISGIPVLETDGRVAGVISEKDFLSRLGVAGKANFMSVIAECFLGQGCATTAIRAQKAEDIMTTPAITVRGDTTADEISTIFTEKNINRVPVVDTTGRLIGIVSRADIVRASLIKGSYGNRSRE